jgi:hypothetical protein
MGRWNLDFPGSVSITPKGPRCYITRDTKWQVMRTWLRWPMMLCSKGVKDTHGCLRFKFHHHYLVAVCSSQIVSPTWTSDCASIRWEYHQCDSTHKAFNRNLGPSRLFASCCWEVYRDDSSESWPMGVPYSCFLALWTFLLQYYQLEGALKPSNWAQLLTVSLVLYFLFFPLRQGLTL